MKTPFNGPDFHQGKTVFLPAPGKKGIVVTNRNGRRRSKPVRFNGPHAALDWAIANAAMLVYIPGLDPSKN